MSERAPELRTFRSPRGAVVRMWCRPGTNDGMMSESALDGDEYGLAGVDLADGLAIDVGAHIGMVAIGLAVDNPAARVVAVEVLEANVDLLRRNATENGVYDRVVAVWAAAGARSAASVPVSYAFAGDELADMHRFVANQRMPDGVTAKVVDVPAVSLAELVPATGARLVVIDAEGAEYGLFAPALAAGRRALGRIDEIRGEYHDGYSRLASLLAGTHDVVRVAGDDGFGQFLARVRS